MTALLVFTAPLFVASVSAAPAETSSSNTDLKLEKTIKAKLQRDRQLGDNRIDVQIQNGVVVLKGTVDTAHEQAKAARLALVKDVVGVDNRLQVASKDSTQATADADLAGNVRAKIAGNMRSDGENVVVEVKNGVVTLSGSVPSQAATTKPSTSPARPTGSAESTTRSTSSRLPPRRERRRINPSACTPPRACRDS